MSYLERVGYLLAMEGKPARKHNQHKGEKSQEMDGSYHTTWVSGCSHARSCVCYCTNNLSFFLSFSLLPSFFPSFLFGLSGFFSFFKPQIIWKYIYFMARKKENPSTCKFIAPRRKMLRCSVHTDGTIWWNTGKHHTDAAVSLASTLQNMPGWEVTFFFLYLPDVFLTSLWCSDSWCPHANPMSVTPCHGQPYLHLQRLGVLTLSVFVPIYRKLPLPPNRNSPPRKPLGLGGDGERGVEVI